MNISQAKEEIKHAISAYLGKDESGNYILDERFCRPLLLMGAPGIGKTAVMSQIASEMGINLVSYTITHHTRQSAIGLPVVREVTFDGKPYSVTEYTMSEILASVYKSIEETGISEGILFLDEINCVSETLLPTMLQFLQYKTFGTHKVPRGFVIACAGNPPSYNRAARDFDIVTLDRVRRLDIDIDINVFFEYAVKARLHDAIRAFLDIKKDYFYRISADVNETSFVTARSWEDLSEMLKAYERNSYPVTEYLISEYVEDTQIAAAFFDYYRLYQKYNTRFAVGDILKGSYRQGGDEITNAPFDEKLSFLHLLSDALGNRFYSYHEERQAQENLLSTLKAQKESLSSDDFAREKEHFDSLEDRRQEEIDLTGDMLENAFLFLDKTFGEGQEMLLFLTSIGRDPYAKEYLAECSSESYNKYSKILMLDQEYSSIRKEIADLKVLE